MDSSLEFLSMTVQLSVNFQDIQEGYLNNVDLQCKYIINNYKVQEGDRIAIFKLGWTSLKNYVLFEWVTNNHCTTFKSCDLPNITNQNIEEELYQFCYISYDNAVHGISAPFQIYSSKPKPTIPKSNTDLVQLLSQKDKEIAKLQEDNDILRETIRLKMNEKTPNESKQNEEVTQLKEVTEMLRKAFLDQQTDINLLKGEVQELRSDYKQVLLEKIMIEHKFNVISKKHKVTAKTEVPDFNLDVLDSFPPFPL